MSHVQRTSEYWENVLATHYPKRRPFSKTANLFVWGLVLAYVFVQRLDVGSQAVFYWAMVVTALQVAQVHERSSGANVLSLEGATLREGWPQIVMASSLFLVIFYPPLLLGARPAGVGWERGGLLLLAAFSESVWFSYVMPQVVPYAFFTANATFALGHDYFLRAFVSGAVDARVITFVAVAFMFNLVMMVVLGGRTWLRGRSGLWRCMGLWVVVVLHFAVNLTIFSYGYLFGVML
jgi:hypothetical protein